MYVNERGRRRSTSVAAVADAVSRQVPQRRSLRIRRPGDTATGGRMSGRELMGEVAT